MVYFIDWLERKKDEDRLKFLRERRQHEWKQKEQKIITHWLKDRSPLLENNLSCDKMKK